MALVAGVLREVESGERRVAVIPKVLEGLTKLGVQSVVQKGAGEAAGYGDDEYASKGAKLVDTAAEVCAEAAIIPLFRASDSPLWSARHTLIGFCDPLGSPAGARAVAARGATLLSMEMVPRITRAQSMDALSSMASVAGYKAVILAANELPRLMPMMTTAAGTISPAKVLVIGAGVAGLQAIATARRLGAVVSGYDVRDAVKEQVESLGAKFLQLNLDTKQASGAGGYAQAMGEDFYRRQREAMGIALKEFDVVITTAAVPGRKAPTLITADMARGMTRGSLIVDLAAERGGNCELTRAGETVHVNGVTILGPVNLPGSAPYHASMMYSRNVLALLQHLIKKGEMTLDAADEITREILVTRGGEVVHPKVKELA